MYTFTSNRSTSFYFASSFLLGRLCGGGVLAHGQVRAPCEEYTKVCVQFCAQAFAVRTAIESLFWVKAERGTKKGGKLAARTQASHSVRQWRPPFGSGHQREEGPQQRHLGGGMGKQTKEVKLCNCVFTRNMTMIIQCFS